MFVSNTLNLNQYVLNTYNKFAFYPGNNKQQEFDNLKLLSLVVCVAILNAILLFLACIIVSDDVEECMTTKLNNAKLFKRTFSNIKAEEKSSRYLVLSVLGK